MPFKSQAQMRYMYKNHPKIAEEFAKNTVNIKKLPEHINNSKRKGSKKLLGSK